MVEAVRALVPVPVLLTLVLVAHLPVLEDPLAAVAATAVTKRRLFESVGIRTLSKNWGG